MPRISVTLSIGYPTACHKDIIEIDDAEWQACKTEEERDDLMHQHWSDWSNNYIDGGFELLDEGAENGN